MNVLILCGNDFIRSHLVNKLIRVGHYVRAFGNNEKI